MGALFGFVRFALIPRGQLVILGHNLMTVLGQQLSLSLLGLSYFLLTFPKLSMSQYFISNFEEIFTSFERTLLLVIMLAHLLNIQYIDKIIPICFGITPIIITILIAENQNIFLMAILSLTTMSIAIIILRQPNYRSNFFLRIRNVFWFHILSSISIYFHCISLIAMSERNEQRYISFYDCITFNFTESIIK